MGPFELLEKMIVLTCHKYADFFVLTLGDLLDFFGYHRTHWAKPTSFGA